MSTRMGGALVALTLIAIAVVSWPATKVAVNDELMEQGRQLVQEVEAQVATDAVSQYNIVVRAGGSPTQRCVQAGMVVAAYLQAQNSTKYTEWQSVQKKDCAAAGIPF